MIQKRFSIADRVQSFIYAFQGLRTFFQTQHNAWIHVFIAVMVIITGFYCGLNANEWLWIVLAIAMVFITEMLNTAIEFLSDFVFPEIHPQIKKVKDVSAAAVLIASIAAVIIGTIIFLPRFF